MFIRSPSLASPDFSGANPPPRPAGGGGGWDKRRQRGLYQPFILIMQVLALLLIQIMSKKPKIDHEYHDRKDKMKISIKGYSPNKRTRKALIKKVSDTPGSSRRIRRQVNRGR